MGFLAVCRQDDLVKPPSAELVARASLDDSVAETRRLELQPLLRASRRRDALIRVLATGSGVHIAQEPPITESLPDPARIGVEFRNPFEKLGTVRREGSRTATLWRVRASNVPKLKELCVEELRINQADARKDAIEADRTVPERDRTPDRIAYYAELKEQILDGIERSPRVRTEFDRWARDHQRHFSGAARYAFWAGLLRFLNGRRRDDFDLIVRGATVLFVEWDRLVVAIADRSGARWDEFFQEYVGRWSEQVTSPVAKRLACVADRALVVSEYRRLPTFSANDAMSFATLEYLLEYMGRPKVYERDPKRPSTFLGRLPPQAGARIEAAIKDAVDGKVDRLAFRRAGGIGDNTTERARETLAEYISDNRKTLLAIARKSQDEGKVLVYGECAAPVPH